MRPPKGWRLFLPPQELLGGRHTGHAHTLQPVCVTSHNSASFANRRFQNTLCYKKVFSYLVSTPQETRSPCSHRGCIGCCDPAPHQEDMFWPTSFSCWWRWQESYFGVWVHSAPIWINGMPQWGAWWWGMSLRQGTPNVSAHLCHEFSHLVPAAAVLLMVCDSFMLSSPEADDSPRSDFPMSVFISKCSRSTTRCFPSSGWLRQRLDLSFLLSLHLTCSCNEQT